MRTTRKMLACSVACLMIFATFAAAGEKVMVDGVEAGKPTQDYDAALAYAKEHKLPLMLNFTGSDWCGWCKTMEANVFSKPAWGSYAKDNLVQVWVDFPRKNPDLVPAKYRDRNKKLQKQFGVRGFPSYIVLDSSGGKIGQLGAGREKSPASFQAEMEKVLIMTVKGMKKFCSTLKPEDAKAVKDAYLEYRALNTKRLAAEKAAAAAGEAADKQQETLAEVMETGKVNAMSPEKKAEYEAAKKGLEKAKADLQAWMQKNGRTRPTPELQKQFMELRKAVQAAGQKVESF